VHHSPIIARRRFTVALQGTLETFALPDVLRLLASTKKTGCYRLRGARGEGEVWVDGGQVVAAHATGAPHAQSPVDVVFELLRFDDGDFAFEDNATATDPGDAHDVEELLASAEAMAADWAEIEAVVPSLHASVSLNPLLPGDDVTIRADHWIIVCAIGGGLTVGRLGDMLQLGELAVSRTVKELVELGVVEVGEAPAGGFAPSEPETSFADTTPFADAPSFAESASFDDPPAFDAAPSFESMPEPEPATSSSLGADDLIIGGNDTEPPDLAPVVDFVPLGDPLADLGGAPVDDTPLTTWDPNALVVDDTTPAPVAAGGHDDGDSADAAEIARQLSNLSPKAAKAVAAAAKATTVEERERALAEVDDSENINRELLLKFLGSVGS
jgi:hypothetical protein